MGAVRSRRSEPSLRPFVSFDRLDLTGDTFPACDVALLRNVFRHLTPSEQRAAIGRVVDAIPADGRLVLGGSDLWRPLGTSGLGHDIEPAGLASRFVEAEHHCIWRPR